jgi:hypothetical protein
MQVEKMMQESASGERRESGKRIRNEREGSEQPEEKYEAKKEKRRYPR